MYFMFRTRKCMLVLNKNKLYKVPKTKKEIYKISKRNKLLYKNKRKAINNKENNA